MSALASRIGARLLQTRGFVRAPIWLFRHRCGWIMGQRVLLLEHRGRTTGLARHVCLEVVAHPAGDSYVVVSGFGERAQWYRNLQAQQRCLVTVGRGLEVPARARFAGREESARWLAEYQRAHPLVWRQLKGAIEQAGGSRVEDLPMVELQLQAPDRPG